VTVRAPARSRTLARIFVADDLGDDA